MATSTSTPPAPSAAAPPSDIFEELVGDGVGLSPVGEPVLGPEGDDVADVCVDVVFVGAWEPGPHTGPLSAGFGKFFGMQLLSKPVKAGQSSLALLQHQSLPSKQNPTDLGFQVLSR